MGDGPVIYIRSAIASALTSSAVCTVNSWNECDPLEEVNVGRLNGAVVPPFHVSVNFNRPHSINWLHRLTADRRYPVRCARTELDGFVRLLEAEGCTYAARSRSTSGASAPTSGRRRASACLPARHSLGRRRRDYRNADVLAVALFRGRRSSKVVQRVFRRWRAVDRAAATSAARRVIRRELSGPGTRGTDPLHHQ
jgi:hypothetical protein